MKDSAPPGIGLKQERREAENREEIKNLVGSRLDHFAGQHALAQGPLCPQFVIEWRVCLLFVGDG